MPIAGLLLTPVPSPPLTLTSSPSAAPVPAVGVAGGSCSGHTLATSSAGRIASGTAPYRPRLNCSWLVHTGTAIVLRFEYVELERNYDFLRLSGVISFFASFRA